MAGDRQESQGAMRHALIVLDPGKLDLRAASEQTLETLRTLLVESAIEELKLTDLTEAQRHALDDAARNALDMALCNGKRRGAAICMLSTEEQ